MPRKPPSAGWAADVRNPYQAESDARAEQASRQPIAETLRSTLRAALEVELNEGRRLELEGAIIALDAACGPQTGDVSPEDALAFLIGVGLLEAGVEPYAVIVAGVRVGVITARNRFHAVNKAKKQFGLVVAEFQRKDGQNEIHGARPVTVSDPFARIRS